MHISFCFAVANRSKCSVKWNGYGAGPFRRRKFGAETETYELQLLPNCLESISRVKSSAFQFEITIADYGSNDWPYNDWIENVLGDIRYRIIPMEGPFSRGAGLNAAATASAGDVIFFIDADMLVSSEVIQRGAEIVQQGMAYFPVCYSYGAPDHSLGWWRKTGWGNLMLPTHLFEKCGRWPENKRWGGEDVLMRRKLKGCYLRERATGFFHQWHPDGIFKTQYYIAAPRSVP